MEYTVVSIASAVCVVVLDRALGIGLLATSRYWKYLGFMCVCLIVTNGYLTARPIVSYSDGSVLGVRIITMPVEDVLFGFSLVTATVVIWERLSQGVSRKIKAVHGERGVAHQ